MDETQNMLLDTASGEQVQYNTGRSYHIGDFEGPLDLLLYLIQKSRVNIYDIPIAEITEQFLGYLNNATEEIPLDDLSEFYKMAANLLYIKSQMLLPVDVEFDEEYTDPRQELIERLLEYQKFKKYTDILSGTEQNGELFIPRRKGRFVVPFEDQDLWVNVGINDLMETFAKLLRSVPAQAFNIYEEVTVNQKITLMTELFEERDKITFSELIVDPTSASHITCAFMSILEATKFKMIYLEQYEQFGEIYITKRELDFDQDLADAYDEEYDDTLEYDLTDEDNFEIVYTDEEKENQNELYDDDEEEIIGYTYSEAETILVDDED